MSLTIQFLLIKLFKDFSFLNFNVLEKSVSWFLIDHISEQYNLTSGKLFLVNEDFRRLITNFLTIIRNLICWIQAITTIELFCSICIICFLLYLGFLNIKRKQYQKWNYKDLLYYSFISLLIVKVYYRYSIFDLFFVSRPFGILFDCVCIFTYIYTIFIIMHCYIFHYKPKKQIRIQLQYIFTKIYFHLVIYSLNLFRIFFLTFSENSSSNNFIQELTLKILFIYGYIYHH